MKKGILIKIILLGVLTSCAQDLKLPIEESGWSDQEAAAHLLNRLAYGPTTAELQLVMKDPERWVGVQLHSGNDQSKLDESLLEKYPILAMDFEEIGQVYPAPNIRYLQMRKLRNEAMIEGLSEPEGGQERMMAGYRGRGNRMGRDSVSGTGLQDLYQRIVNAETEMSPRYERINQISKDRFGWEDFAEPFYQQMSNKLELAIKSPNQLEEVMVDFWYNHFNVSIHSVNDIASQVFSYERDAIRPNALGNFRDLLEATSKHPAMLLYLDNNRSNAEKGVKTLAEPDPRQVKRMQERLEENPELKQLMQQSGVNENYARELLELHTMGVDGGYTQKDVEEIARIFTGWKVSPAIYPIPDEMRRKINMASLFNTDIIIEDGFRFDPTRHDAESKVVLGVVFPAGGGIEEGEKVLDMLASHPSTAKFICYKLAQRFIADEPPNSIVDQLVHTFLKTDGDIKSILATLFTSQEFWDPQYKGAKIKTPLEVIASSIRILDSEVENYRPLIKRCTQMGQPLYAYQAPTGYPEQGAYWTNGSALINRMNFANELASGQIDGVSNDLLALNQHRVPASKQKALETYLPILIPGRETAETKSLLTPVLSDQPANQGMMESSLRDEQMAPNDTDGLATVVGLILGSPEFQRQ